MMNTGKGYLIVNVSEADGAVPIGNADVKCYLREYKKDGAYKSSDALSKIRSDRYEYIRVTDSSGITRSITLETPDVFMSFGQNRDSPYSVCDVTVRKDGFFTAVILGVQIFPGRESILPVTLEPFSECLCSLYDGMLIPGSFCSIEEIPMPTAFDTESHPRNRLIYPGSVDAEPYIATKVYIPERITVHLGAPSADADNVTLPFTDYIKNVASSEIFPTWPENAILANVYAQISIALNRVYTEWYESQGYDFQITGTTAYDQCFVYGRNIYDNISIIVDRVFNTYISRIGFAEPLFASYCDGMNSSCDGMTQWGSFYLAGEGLSPIGILRYFYGDNIELVSTDDIRGIESTYGGVPLSIGYVSDSVALIQAQLNRIRLDYPAIPRISNPNGVFGLETDDAVRRFQEIFNLPPDGVVGKATWYRISFIYVSVTRLAELTSEGMSEDFPEVTEYVELMEGTRGDSVAALQFFLEYISLFYKNVIPPKIDGVFGAGTREALLSFQRSFGLDETATTTPETWDALLETYNDILAVIFPLGEDQKFRRKLSLGSTGEDVERLQRYLNRIISEGLIPDVGILDVDGSFGRMTQAAVQAFQRYSAIDASGIIGPQTWLRIVELYNYLERQ